MKRHIILIYSHPVSLLVTATTAEVMKMFYASEDVERWTEAALERSRNKQTEQCIICIIYCGRILCHVYM